MVCFDGGGKAVSAVEELGLKGVCAGDFEGEGGSGGGTKWAGTFVRKHGSIDLDRPLNRRRLWDLDDRLAILVPLLVPLNCSDAYLFQLWTIFVLCTALCIDTSFKSSFSS